MFDKLVESNTAEAEFKPRRKFFMVSTVIVGILFLTAVVASLYASSIDLGNDNFDLAELLAPIAQTEPMKEEEPREQQQNQQQERDFTRQVLMASTDDPTRVPERPSTDRNPHLSTPPDKYRDVKIGGSDSIGPPDFGRPEQIGSSSNSASSESENNDVDQPVPPLAPKAVPKTKTLVSGGVVNGKATHLPKPNYSAAAVAMQVKGAVNVQVTIDETGKVISAKAVSGHQLLRPSAEKAAWSARFTPTVLTGMPVKVTGVIVYNFTR